MKIFAFICTRSREISEVTDKLLTYLSSLKVEIKLLVNQKSIFSAYSTAFNSISPNPEDIVILCHDDIEILMPREKFKKVLIEEMEESDLGFVGIAGTTYLSKNAVWWDQQQWQLGKHSGSVIHMTSRESSKVNPYLTEYGPCRRVAVLDGCFLATKVSVLNDLDLNKPTYFKGEWDFYDLYYTSTTFKKGLVNKTIPLKIAHHSYGELAGRESWFTNKDAFIRTTDLPLDCSKIKVRNLAKR